MTRALAASPKGRRAIDFTSGRLAAREMLGAAMRSSPHEAGIQAFVLKATSNAAGDDQYDNDDENETEAAAGIITPAAAVGPRWQRADQQQDQNDNQSSVKKVDFRLVRGESRR
jgi:hypothetical protein